MERKTGVVIPLGALYTKDSAGIGEFPALKKFADFCKLAEFKIIQLLPVNDTGTQSSPYSGLSAFALHPLYISIESLPEFDAAFKSNKAFAGAYKTFKKEFKYHGRYDYDKILNEKIRILHLLYSWIEKQILSESKVTLSDSRSKTKVVTAVAEKSYAQQFEMETNKFVKENKWVVSYAVYKNLKDSAMQASWKEWPENLQHLSREQIQLRWNNRALKSSHNFFVWCQMRAAEQFKDAADYVKSLGIILKGDLPILMNEDSCDCWSYPEFFNHTLRAGSPVDGENPLGQSWGFPTYNWTRLGADDYSWWKDRIKCASQYYSAFRIDHVLGFFRIWAVNENETTAYLGHAEPCKTFSSKELNALDFDEGRIRWLSKPHIPTSLIQNITGNYEEAHNVLSKVADRIGNEELWLFKNEIEHDKQIYSLSFYPDDKAKDDAVKNALTAKWRDRTIIELSENNYVKTWTFYETTAWKSLNQDEQNKLKTLFDTTENENEKLWKDQATDLLSVITSASDMTSCAEDLGAVPSVVPEVLCKLNILSLRVVRWCREWGKQNQPYVAFANYPELSVTTTSVHDSPTLRQWWNDEKQSVSEFIKLYHFKEENSLFDNIPPVKSEEEFSPEVASFCLQTSAATSSEWYVNPLQDYLFLEKKYYLENQNDERINIPGTVTAFNWTYRIPATVESLSDDKDFISKINNIVQEHDKKNK